MSKLKIFVSSNQKEFKSERLSIKRFIENTPIYNNLFEVFIFENTAAEGRSPDEIYLKEVEESDIFIGLIGENYGKIHRNGLSASEEEFDTFLKSSKRKNTFVYILENINPDENTKKFMKKIHTITYDSFNHENLLIKIQRSLEKFLYGKGILQSKDFDERFVLESSYEDVDEEKVKYFLEISDSTTKVGEIDKDIKNTLMNRLNVLNNNFNLNNTGILFFSKQVEKFLPQNEIRMVKFRGTERVNIIDKKFINTTVYEALKEIELFFNRNTSVRSEINGFKREDIEEYPYEAIREAVVNAIAHRDYNIKCSPISFLIFSDRIEITSPGGLTPPLTLDELGKKIVHRNNNICKLLEKTSYMEIIGSGIPRMREKMKEFNLPEVEFIENNGFFEVIFRNSKKIDVDELKLNHRQSEVLKLLKTKKEINLNQYMKLFSISKTTASRDLKELNNLKYINKIFINKKQIKYTLNPKILI
ncbi:MAG: DUF4062 domain-containing protein [Methanobrevibacter sp.]|jgi:predicted HTH transcriptional regulator|nr:DUF4062 domain-containing protein [Methanobrevibacter sp.]